MIKKFVNKLPVVLQTDTQKEFFSATFDQLFSPAEVDQAQGFIGRRSSEVFQPGKDNYLSEPTKLRAAYQLEPIAYAVNSALQDTNEVFYEDLLNYVQFRGGNTLNHDRLFADHFYSFAPPIDVDKYLNYQNYIWMPDGSPIIYIQYVGPGGATAFDTIIENQIVGSASFNTSQNEFLRPRGLELSSGMRVRFEGSASWDRNLYVEGVGRTLRLVEELTTLLPGSAIDNIPWDNSIVFDGGTGYTMFLTAVNSITNGGSGYTALDVLTLVSPGDLGFDTAATITVNTVGGGGVITSVSITTPGDYLFAPLGPVAVTGGTGTGATFDVTIQSALLTVVGGTFTTAATVRPVELSTAGKILVAELVNPGTYTVYPTSPASLSGGAGSGAKITFVPGGDIGEKFDATFFDAAVTTDLSHQDYLTIERGSAEGSPWTRTNRWFNVDIIDTTQSLGQILDATIISGGLNYSIGDVLPVEGDGINGTVTVTAVNGVGTITGIRVSGRGQGYSFGGIDQTGAAGAGGAVLWDEQPPGISPPDGTIWDTSFAWDQQIFSGGGTNAIIAISLATAISKSNKAKRPIIEFRRDIQLFNFGNKFLTEVEVVADTETLSDVEGQTTYVIDGVELADGMKMIFLDPTSIPNFFEWDETPLGPNSTWDTVPWEAEGSSGAVSRYIWQVDKSSGVIALNKVDPITGLTGGNVSPVPVGGVVLATLGNIYAGNSFYQFQDPLTFVFNWRQGQIKNEPNVAPLYELYDINAINLADPIQYPNSTFAGNEIFSYRILTAADLADTGGTLQNDPVLGFPLTLKGLRQVSDIVFENDLETNRVQAGSPLVEIPGYYFFREWETDAFANIETQLINGQIVQLSEYNTNWATSDRPERQRVIDRFLTQTATENRFKLSAQPLSEAGAILVAEGRRLNTDEFAFIPATQELLLFKKPTDTGFEAADGIKQIFSFPGITDPVEIYLDKVYQVRGQDYEVLQSLQLSLADVSSAGVGYTVNDVLTVNGGTNTVAAQIRVVATNGTGGITGISIVNAGVYTAIPSNPFLVSGGTGTGASFDGTWIDAHGGVFTIRFLSGPVANGSFVEAREQASGAPGINVVVEVIYSTFEPIFTEDRGYFEIPNGLENNPNNREILDQSWNELAPHMVSIIENQFVYLGTAFGSVNNYRDTLKDGSQGTFILQSQSPLLKTMLLTSSNELDLIEALRFSGKEYARFRNKFLKTAKQMIDQGFENFNSGDSITTNAWVDEAIRRIIRSREFANAFTDTYMVGWNTVFKEETSTATGVDEFNTFTIFADLQNKINVLYVYLDGVLQRVDQDYTISNLNPIQIHWKTIPATNTAIVARIFENSAPAHIPATPAKLGLMRPSIPRIETDTSYQNPINVIIGHDGSRTPVFGDYRDDLLFELEVRIYNGIIDKFRNDYEIPLEQDTLKPGKFRETRWTDTEWNKLLRPAFFKWIAAERADYITNEFYDGDNPWTWNYGEVRDIDGDLLPGYWRGIFDKYYDTQTPQTTPWEMLGFNLRPDWWTTTTDNGDGFSGYGPGPWPASHMMWVDLENGRIRRGFRAGTDTRYARAGLVAKYLPVDNLGARKATPLLCIDTTATLIDPTSVQAAKNWKYSDLAPVEYAWRIGEQFPFALSEAMYLARPGEFGEKFWDPEHVIRAFARPSQIISDIGGSHAEATGSSQPVYRRVGNDVRSVHGETINGVQQVNTGYQVWVSCRLRTLNKDLGNDFGQLLRTLDVKLGHKMASFTDKDTLRTFVEGISVSSLSTNLLVPAENINVALHTSPPVHEYFYGGVLLRTTADGKFQVFGYDILAGEFTYIPRTQSANDQNINVGGQPETFVNFVAGPNKIYIQNQVVRFNTVFYRALVTHEALTFDQSKWQKLSKLPITGGINVTYKPNGSGLATLQYGEMLSSPQEVFDFLIGYGDWLKSEGWQFNNPNKVSGEIENWVLAGKEFLLWVNTSWAPNNIVQLSPAANMVELQAQEGYPASVERIINGVYSILDKNGVAIDPLTTIIKRDNRNIKIISAIEQIGIFGARVDTTETESIVTFDNTTDFNDSIYDPLLGTRLARLIFRGRRTLNWTGKLEAGGYIITDTGLIPNYENLVNSIRLYHDTETTLDNPNIEATARHLIGFTERDYFENLQILDDTQFQFFQGEVRQKGTIQSIRKLERDSVIGETDKDMQVFEEWALRLANFGAVCGNQLLEFKIFANEVKVDPQLVQLSYPASNTAGTKVFFTNNDVTNNPTNTIAITSHGYTDGEILRYDIPTGQTGTITGLTSGSLYSVIVVDANTIKLALPSTPNTTIALTKSGGGTQQYSLETPINGHVKAIEIVSSGKVYTLVPTVSIVNNPDDTQGSGATATAVLNSDGTLLRVDVLEPGQGYVIAPYVYIFADGDSTLSDDDDRAIATLEFEVTVDEPNDDVIIIDVDDNSRWINGPADVACDVENSLFPTISEQAAYDLPNAGFVSTLDTTFRHISTEGLDALAQHPAPPSEKGQTIHVAYGEAESFSVYALNNLNTTVQGLAIQSQLTSTNDVYAKGRVILTQLLTNLGEDSVLASPTITFSTNGSGLVRAVNISNGGYGYFTPGTFTITDHSLAGNADAVISYTTNAGAMTLNMVQQTVDAQTQANFNGSGGNGTFAAGSGYIPTELITLSDGTVVQVNSVSGGPPGPVVTFVINSPSTTSFITNPGTLTQVSSTGSGTGFALTLGGNNTEFVTPVGSGYTVNQTNVSVNALDIPGPTQSGRYIGNVAAGGIGKIYADNLLYDYSYTGALTGTTLVVVARGTGYTIGDALSVNGGVSTVHAATISVDSVRTISGQTQTSFSGVAPNGAFSGGSGYAGSDTIVMDDGTVVTVNTVSVGVVATFTITTAGGALSGNLSTIRQATTSGGGTGFELTLGHANEQVFEYTLTSGGAYTTNPVSPVTVNGGTGSGATFTLGGFLPLYDITKDGVAVEDETFADDTPFFILTNLRVPSTTTRDLFVQQFLTAGARYIWVDNDGTGNWAVYNITAPIVSGQTQANYDGGWSSGDEGTFEAGTGHSNGNVITLTDGSTITVNSVGADGNVITFTVATPSTTKVQIFDTLDQVSTTGSGIGFSLTVNYKNLNNGSITFTVRSQQGLLVDTAKFKNAFVYDAITKDTITQLPVYDPFKGLIPGPADLNLKFKSRRDPARYNNSADPTLLSDTRLFGGKQVGMLWWDLSTSAFLYYEQGTDTYRRDHWGKLIDGSSVDIYEWTRSSSLPAAYAGDGTVRSTTEYVQTQEYDPFLEEVRTFYYFWVKNRTIIPAGVNRTLAAFEVGRMISNPAIELYQWFSPVSQSAFMFSGVEGVFTDSDNVFQINYRNTTDEEPKHVEWELGREGDPDYVINDKHWNKMVDSLCGFTDLIVIDSHTDNDIVASFLTDASGINAGTEVITTLAPHGFSSGEGVTYSNNGGVATIGLTNGQMYYVNSLSSTTLALYATYTNAIADTSRINLSTSGAETHKLTAETTSLDNFNNAIPSVADPTMGYLIVPDPALSDSSKLGIKTRPMQSMFSDMLAARRIFVDKVNQLVAGINLRDENPTWNASMTTNNLWQWIDWYADGYSAVNAIPTYQVADTNDLQNLLGIEDKAIVKVTGTRFKLYVHDKALNRFELIGREASRLELLPIIYTGTPSLATATELRELIAALKANVFTIDRVVYSNLVFFALLNYVFTEQEDLDWAFKTTYLFLKQQGRDLVQDRVFQEDPFDSALQYITEVKPYQTKVRDFRIQRATDIDLLPGTADEIVRNFNISMLYDRIRGGDLSVAEMRAAKREGGLDASWKGYASYDSDTIQLRLGAAGRFVVSQRDLIGDIADVSSSFFEAYSTQPVQATFTINTNAIGQVSSVSIINPGQGYYTNGTFLITNATLAGNSNAIITYTVDTSNSGSIATATVSNPGSGYTINQVGVSVNSADLPVPTSKTITDDELAAVAAINLRITDALAFDFEGLFIENTLFTGYPSLISATIASGGTGYVVNDTLQLDAGSGVPISNAQFRVATTTGPGTITSLQLINGGSYQQTPTVDPVTLLGGTGSGATVTSLVFETGSSVPFDSTPWDQIGMDSSVNDPTVDTFDGDSPILYRTIDGQSQADFNGVGLNGTFVGGDGAGGTAYAPADTIKMSDGTDITVNAVNGNGDVTQFSISGGSTSSVTPGTTITQALTSGTGLGFTITLALNNIVNGDFFAVPPEETLSGDGNTREFTLTTSVPNVFLFVVSDGVERRRNVDYFFIGNTLVFLDAPNVGVDNIKIFTYIEAGDLINPQVAEGITEEMIPLDPRENLIIIADTVDVQLANGGTGYSVSDVLTVSGGVLKGGGLPMEITVLTAPGGVIATFSVSQQGDYYTYPTNPVGVTGGTGTGATFNLVSVSFRIHEDTQQGITYTRNADEAGSSIITDIGTTDGSISIVHSEGLVSDIPSFDSPGIAWIGTERIEYFGVDARTIPGQDETNFDNLGDNGTFVGGDGAGGTAYVALDTITMSDGTVVRVDAVDGNGDVTQFTILTAGISAIQSSINLTQISTSGTGTDFAMTLGIANRFFNALTGVRRGTKGTHAQAHLAGEKVFSGADNQLIPSPNEFWVNSASTNQYNGTNGQWRFVGVGQLGRSVVHFSDTTNNSFAVNVDVGDNLVVSDLIVGRKYYVLDHIAVGELGIVTVTAPGTGYEVGDVIDIDTPAVGGTGVTAEIGAVDGNGGIRYVRITNRGTGYTSVGAVVVTNANITSTGGAGATLNAFFDTQGLVVALPDRILDSNGIVAEVNGLTWQTDAPLVGGGLATSTGTAAAFLQNAPGNAL